MSARWAFSCASWECRWAYWRVLLEAEEEEKDEVADEALLVAAGFDDDVAAAKDEGLAGGWWEVEGAIWHVSEVGREDGGTDLWLDSRTGNKEVNGKQRFGYSSTRQFLICSRRGIWMLSRC